MTSVLRDKGLAHATEEPNMEPGSLGEALSVDCVLMSTYVLGDPPRYCAATA